MAATIQYFVDSTGQIWAVTVQSDGSLQTQLVGSQPPPVTSFYNTTAGSIISSVIGDAQNELNNSSVLIDYVDRISKRILRESQWGFLRSTLQRFITEPGVTDYWIGTGTAPAGTVNTGLNLSNVWSIDPNSVWNRSLFRQLMPNSRSVNYGSPNLSTQDAQPRMDAPKTYEYNLNNPNIIRLFPAPSDGNTYKPVPLPPVCVSTVAGALPARQYYVYVTFVDSAGGESVPSMQPVIINIPAGSVLNVQQPQPVVASADSARYSTFNVYVGTTATNATLQNASPQNTTWVEPTNGLVAGVSAPTTSTIQPLYGYIIEFVYLVQRTPITTQNQVLQIPDYYRDVVIAGVNWLTNLYLNKDPELTKSSAWKAEFQDGLRQIRKDLNVNFRSTDFIAPDNASQLSYSNGLDQFDPVLGEI